MRILGLGDVSWLAHAPTAGKEPEKGMMPMFRALSLLESPVNTSRG